MDVIKPFKFFHDGINPTEYATGVQELPADAAAVALAEGWAVASDAGGDVTGETSDKDATGVQELPAGRGRGRK